MTLKVLELFGGIGACTAAMKRLGIDFEVVDYVEIDKHAVASYNAINGTNFTPQDVTKWDKDIKVDFIMHGSPCQDFSLAGVQKGGDKGSGTRSSLMYETVRIVEKLRPKYVCWENVANLLSEKHFHNFANYINTLAELGYSSAYKVLNAKDYGIPQNRERVFTISVLDGASIDLFGHELDFHWPQPFELNLRLKDMLQDNPESKYFLSHRMIEYCKRNEEAQRKKGNGFKWEVTEGDTTAKTVTTHPGSRMHDNFIAIPTRYFLSERAMNGMMKTAYVSAQLENRLCQDISPALRARDFKDPLLTDYTPMIDTERRVRIRKLTPRECWRLMGRTDDDFEKAEKVCSNSQLYKQAGNSIVVDVLVYLFDELFRQYPTEDK